MAADSGKISRRIKKLLNNPWVIFPSMNEKGWLNWLPDNLVLNILYRGRVGKKLNLKNPQTFNEKLQWLKLFDRNPLYSQLVDKYEARKYIATITGEEYLIPILGIYNSFEEIDFNLLPHQFVLKCTHDSGGIVICTNKDKLDLEAVKNKINRHLQVDFFYHGREWPYKNLKPRIICEKYMVDESGTELKDYKVFCFNGEPKLIEVDYNRFSEHKRNFYDIEWNYIPVSINYPTDPGIIHKKPEKLKDMLQLAQLLAKDFLHIRIDFYLINDQVYIGELTFFHGSGFGIFEPDSFNWEMGSWIRLPYENE